VSWQKVEMVIQYIDHSECHIWTSLQGYIDLDWDEFCDKLCQQYVNLSNEGQFSKQKLVRFANKYAQRCMANEKDVVNYYWKFNNQAKILIDSECITKSDCDTIFWCRFHLDDQQAL
jgi:hypothetical protein